MLDAGRRVGVGGEGDFGFVNCDFILVDWYISGVSGPRVEPGANRGGGPGGARAFFLIDPPTLPYRQVRSWGWGAKQYCAFGTDPRTPFGVGGLNSQIGANYRTLPSRNERARNAMGQKCYVLAEKLAQLSQLGGETTIFKKLFPHSVSLFPKTLSNLAW